MSAQVERCRFCDGTPPGRGCDWTCATRQPAGRRAIAYGHTPRLDPPPGRTWLRWTCADCGRVVDDVRGDARGPAIEHPCTSRQGRPGDAVTSPRQ